MRSICVLLALLPSLAFAAEDASPSLEESSDTQTEQPAPPPKPEESPAVAAPAAPAAKPEAPRPARARLPLAGPAPKIVLTFEATDPGVRDAAPRVEQELAAALGRDGRLAPVLVGTGEEAPPAREGLDEVKQHTDAARSAYDGLDLDTAAQEYANAVKVHFAHPLSADPREIAQLFTFMGAAYQLNGDKAHADAAYRFALAISPSYQPDSENFGPDIRTAFAAQKEALEGAQASSPTTLDVEAEGAPGAEVTVDGEARGAAPVRGLKVYPGRHLVVLKARGYQPAAQVVSVPAGEQGSVKLALQESEAHRRFAGPVARARANQNLPEPGPGVNELARAAGARLVAVGSLASSGTGAKISVVLFDTQTQKRLAGLSRDTLVESSGFPAAMDDLAVELGNDFVEPPHDAVAEESGPSKPLTQRWYFWAGVGAVGAAALAGAVAGTVALAPDEGAARRGAGFTLGVHKL